MERPLHPLNGMLVGSRNGPEVLEKRKISCPCRETNYSSSRVQHVGPVTILTELSVFAFLVRQKQKPQTEANGTRNAMQPTATKVG